MSYSNCLPADSYEEPIGQIHLEWHGNAKMRLPSHAATIGGDARTLKAVTEHLAHACAVRLGENVGSAAHETTTLLSTGDTFGDEEHISIMVKQGDFDIHIYLDGIGEGPTAFDNLRMKGESVMKGSKLRQDLSIGTYPPPIVAQQLQN